MPIKENPKNFCRKCRTLLKQSVKGPVCRNPRCKLLVSFEKTPIMEVINDISHNGPDVGKNGCCPSALIDVKNVFERMQYLGSVQSRANQYFCYSYQNTYINFTGLKEKTNFNAFTLNDLNTIEEIIKNQIGNESFSSDELQLQCQNYRSASDRIKKLASITSPNKDEFKQLYYLALNCCYTLTALGFLTLEKHGRAIRFSQNPKRIFHVHDPSVYSKLQYLFNINKNTAVFDMNSFFLEVRFNAYRGTLIPYTKDEIEYLGNLVDTVPKKTRLNITELMNSMDYSYRFHQLYDLLELRNIRNERHDREFFERRIKSGLELVSKLYKNLRVDKDGRTKIFIKS